MTDRPDYTRAIFVQDQEKMVIGHHFNFKLIDFDDAWILAVIERPRDLMGRLSAFDANPNHAGEIAGIADLHFLTSIPRSLATTGAFT